MSFAALRDAPWLNRERIRGYAGILIACYCIAIAWVLTGPGLLDPLGNPKGSDFVSFWTVSNALHSGEEGAIYLPPRLAEFEQRAIGASDQFFAFSYPPIMLLVIYPLALLPYLWSLAAWVGLSLLFYLRTLWRIVPDRLALWSALAFPATFVNVTHGQNGLLIAGLFGTALSLLPRHPWLSGTLFGMVAVKPHLGLLLPLALLAAGGWRTAIAAALAIAAMSAFVTVLFGASIWSAFVASLPVAREILDQGLVPYFKFQSLFAQVRVLGGSLATAYAAQAIITLFAATAILWIWRTPVEQPLKNAALAVAAPLATPFVLDYDLALLALAVAWLVGVQMRRGAEPWEKTVLVATFAAPWLARPLAHVTGVIVTPFIEVALLGLLCRRCRLALRAPLAIAGAAP